MNKVSSKHGKRHHKSIKAIPSVMEVVFECKNVDHLDQLPGLRKIEVSPLAQKFVGCRVGEDVTTDTPWVLVDKEKIEDHLELYEENSDFLPIMDDIKMMPPGQILMGTHHYIQDDKIEYYVCVTPEAQNILIEAVEKEKRTRLEKILNSLSPITRKWKSLGSEPQVNCDLNRNIRPLFVVDLEGYMPIQKQKTRFTMRNVENMQNGYIELVTTRSTINIIFRKRMDIGVQSSPWKENKGVQVIVHGHSHKGIQYSIEFDAVKLTDNLLTNLCTFILDKFNEFKEMLKLNFSLDLYYDDYKYLGKGSSLNNIVGLTEIKSYQDVINCRRRKISCFTWNAIFSGIVAAGHAPVPLFCIENSKSTRNVEFETVFDSHLVLIWHYKNNVQPMLYLHASRDVSALSFCPYNPHILVGGYNNGQIAVWDLTNKLDSKEHREFLTDIQQKNHLLVTNETRWFKQPLAGNHVFPVLCSCLEDGHRDTVTSIQWIPPSKFIAAQRDYRDSAENEPHMQFITASVDGYRILVWDLYISEEQGAVTFKKKCVRLSTNPEALLQNISPLSVLKKCFKPVCQLIIKSLSFPVTSLLMQDQLYYYVAKNPQTLSDIDQLTYFNVFETENSFDYTPKLYFTTGIGTFHEATWETSDYDPKYFVVNEKCNIEKYADIHDGPVLVCEANPYLQNVILTIGGSVVAIWYLPELKIPVVWRKSRERYLTGMWSLMHPLSFLVVRSDTRYEIWNIIENSYAPIQTFKYKGYKSIKLYKDASRTHVRKKTCVITDTVGAFKLYTVPSESMDLELYRQESVNYLQRLMQIKENSNQLKQWFSEKQKFHEPAKEEDVLDQVPEKIVPEEKVETEVARVPLTQKMKNELKLQKDMRKILYEKQRINVTEIEKNKKILHKIAANKKAKENKIIERRSKRDEIFKKAKDFLNITETEKIRRPTLKFDTKDIKETYLDEYKKIEAEIVKKIRETKHNFALDWPNFLMNHKQRYK